MIANQLMRWTEYISVVRKMLGSTNDDRFPPFQLLQSLLCLDVRPVLYRNLSKSTRAAGC